MSIIPGFRAKTCGAIKYFLPADSCLVKQGKNVIVGSLWRDSM